GQILPASAAAQNPQKAFGGLAVGGPWPAAASSRTWTRKQGPDLLPLGVGQQTTVSRHRPSSGAADLVYLAFPSTQLPQNSGLAPSFETASSHIETRDEKQQCDRRRQNEQCRLQVAACHPRELFAQIADDRCDLCHPTSSGRFLNDTVMKPNQLALSARHGNARFESPEDSDRRVDGFS